MVALSPNRLVLIALLLACFVFSSTTRAQEPSEAFVPLFVELPGWNGSKPFFRTRKVADGLILTTGRGYMRGDEQVVASVSVVPNRVNKPIAPTTFETKQARVVYSMIDGWQVASTFGFEHKSNILTVALGTNGELMLLAPKGIADGDLLPLARRFDWKALEAAVLTFAGAR